MDLPLTETTNITLENDKLLELSSEFKQLDALLVHYSQIADLKTYRHALDEVKKLKHDTLSAASRGDDVAQLRASLVQEVYDLAWAIYDCPLQG